MTMLAMMALGRSVHERASARQKTSRKYNQQVRRVAMNSPSRELVCAPAARKSCDAKTA
jgi:hypothetical protein